MMNNDDRKKVFWLLKKYSSYTAWKALGDAFQEFTNAWEYAVQQAQPPLDSDGTWVEALKGFWKGVEGFDKGLKLLKQGDRYIFRYINNWLIEEKIEYARRLMDPDEYVHDWMINKDGIYAAHQKIEKYKKFFWVTENPDRALPATFDAETVFWTNTWPRHLDYAQFNFPPELANVPDPTTTTVNSGKEVPIDGIWEPEWPDPAAKKGTVVNIRSLFSTSLPSDVQKGCMNYFIAGTIAPSYQDGEKLPVMSVRWRLIWQDARYKDGTIPVEEADYLATSSALQSNRENHTNSTFNRVEGGQPCSQAGYWFTPAQVNSRRHFKEGDIMPVIGSDYGTIIWQWDSNQA